MDFMTSKRSWLTAPVVFFLGAIALTLVWCALPVDIVNPLFDNNGASPVELMTLAFFALIIPLVWLCSPFEGSVRRQAFWCADVSILSIMAIIRETDLHKALFASFWPEVASSFKGTVFKMKFLTSSAVPIMPKIFVAAFFAVFFAAVVGTFAYFAFRLIKGIFKLDPVAWTWAVFGGTATMVLVVDRIPAILRHNGFDGPLLDKHTGSIAALMRVFEEGGEMMMALFALMGILQAHLFVRERRKYAIISRHGKNEEDSSPDGGRIERA